MFVSLQMVSEKTEVTDAMIGGNASAEGGADEGAEDVEARGCDIALANRLKEANMDKGAFKDYIKVSQIYPVGSRIVPHIHTGIERS